VTEAGTSKLGGDPGLHNNPLGCGASEVYASGPDSEEEEYTVLAACGMWCCKDVKSNGIHPDVFNLLEPEFYI